MSGSITKQGQRFTVQFERSLTHAPEKVWRVITEKELMKQWFPAHVLGDWTVGAKLEFIFQHGEGEGLPEEELRGEVLAVEPPRLLEFRWGTSRLRCELVEEDDGCRLIFSENFEDGSIAAIRV